MDEPQNRTARQIATQAPPRHQDPRKATDTMKAQAREVQRLLREVGIDYYDDEQILNMCLEWDETKEKRTVVQWARQANEDRRGHGAGVGPRPLWQGARSGHERAVIRETGTSTGMQQK